LPRHLVMRPPALPLLCLPLTVCSDLLQAATRDAAARLLATEERERRLKAELEAREAEAAEQAEAAGAREERLAATSAGRDAAEAHAHTHTRRLLASTHLRASGQPLSMPCDLPSPP